MEFITEEIKTKLGLTPEQIEGIKPLYDNAIAEKQKGWDDKANQNAEGILNGAVAKISEVTKITRNQGEKVADYIVRAGNEHLSTLKTDLENAKTEYAQKLKDFKGDDATKAELQKAKDELDNAKKQLADYDDLKAKAEKLEPLETEYKSMKMQIAFQSVKPNFPDTVNPYEAKAKWDEFVKGVQEKYNIELIDGVAQCKDKDNEYKVVTLSELVKNNEELSKLLQGRQQGGAGGKETEKRKLEGIPFEIPKEASSEEISKLIQEQLLKEGVNKTAPTYASKFKALHDKIKEGLKS